MSAGQLRADGAVLDGCTDRLVMKHSGIEAAQLNWVNNVLAFKIAQPIVIDRPLKDLVLASINYRTMHRRLMHASKEVVYKACKKAGIKITGNNESFCESCHLGKATEQYPPCSTVPVDRPLAFVRVDSIRHTPTGHLGYTITVHFIDMHSGYRLAKALGLNKHAQFPYIMHLRSYLSTAYVYIKRKDQVQSAKMAPRAKKGLLIGYIDQRGRLFWVWLPEEGRIIKATAVKFHESDTNDHNENLENVEYEAVLDDPTVHDILQDSGATTTGITMGNYNEHNKTHDEILIPTVESKMLTPDGSDDTVPFPTPEQTPEQESPSDNSQYSPGNSGPDEAMATERFVEVRENTKEIQVGNTWGKEREILDEEIAEDGLGILSNKGSKSQQTPETAASQASSEIAIEQQTGITITKRDPTEQNGYTMKRLTLIIVSGHGLDG
jgi:hypothetical protein